MKVFRILLLALIALFITLFVGELLLSCTKRQSEATTVIFGRAGDSVGLDPARESDGESFAVSEQIFDCLIEFNPGTTEIIPSLAEKWDISKDNLVYVFYLRKGVKFHDGTPVNAQAVVFSFERQFKEDNEYNKYGPWKYWGYMDMSSIIESVTAKDDYTVEFRLKRVEAPFLSDLAMTFSSIVSPTAFMKDPEGFSSHPVGSGAFKFVSWTKDSEIVLEKNNDYWGSVMVDRVILKVIPDATARWLALQKAEVDLIEFPSADDLPAMEKDSNIQLIQQPGLNVGYLALNTQKKPYDDKRVRQAMNYAINKKEIIKAVYGNAGQEAKNPLPPIIWSYNDDIEEYPYNPKKAMDLLMQAGYPNGFNTQLWAMPVARPYNPNARKVAEIMQAQLAKVNIKAEIISYEWGTYLDKTDNGEHQAAMLGWTGDNGDPDNFLFVLLSIPSAEVPASNIAFWKNEEFNNLIIEAKTITDVDQRSVLYKKAQEIFHEEAPWVPIAHSVVTVPTRKYVKNYYIYPTGIHKFKYVKIVK